MAETLGSLVDKLTIKSIREFYLNKMINSRNVKFSRKNLKEKLKILKKQKRLLSAEIEEFVVLASRSKVALREDKLKLYNKPEDMGRIGRLNNLSSAIDSLAKKNLQLWSLEDEARRQDVSLGYIGRIKKKIDIANQQRNDLIDKIDELLQVRIRKNIKKKPSAR